MRKVLAPLRTTAVVLSALCSPLLCQAPAVSIHPMRVELEVNPGAERTAAFEIRAAPFPAPERGRLLLSLTDWTIREDGSLTYCQPGSLEKSASSWIVFSPSALTVEPGRSQLVRVTVKVPERTQPGVYRGGLFVEERPPATPPEGDQRVIFVRVRYAVILYVVVPPVYASPELVNVEVDTSGQGLRLTCDMRNTGSRHVRPLVNWSIRKGPAAEAGLGGKIDATVLLPFSTLREPYALQHVTLAPGGYEVSVLVDFQDGRPLQSMIRAFEVADSGPPKVPVLSAEAVGPGAGGIATAPQGGAAGRDP